jgi:hypothetical protein
MQQVATAQAPLQLSGAGRQQQLQQLQPGMALCVGQTHNPSSKGPATAVPAHCSLLLLLLLQFWHAVL